MVSTMPAMPGKRQRRADHRQRGDDHADVGDERDIGDDAEKAVGDQHEHDDGDGADQRGDLAGGNRIGAEPRPDGAFLDEIELGGKRAGAQQHGQIVGAIDAEIARDLAGAAADRFTDYRRRNHDIVENDGKWPTDIGG